MQFSFGLCKTDILLMERVQKMATRFSPSLSSLSLLLLEEIRPYGQDLSNEMIPVDPNTSRNNSNVSSNKMGQNATPHFHMKLVMEL